MLVKDYLKSKLTSVGLTLTEVDLLDLGVNNTDIIDTTNREQWEIVFIKSIPKLLLKPNSISEGGTSITYASKKDVMSFYSKECKRLGITDEINVDRVIDLNIKITN